MNQADMSGSNANSSDFVKKLYKMLEDKTHEDVVRWGNEGDSFVVLENEKFTKSILPKNFKHSNFASFVRQLNKYDFHKVRQTNEDNGQSPYGAGAWEFKHPEFQADKKDALDNIRRKAPAPRKANSSMDDVSGTSTQMDLMNAQLAGTHHQVQFLQDKYDELTNSHVVLLQQVVQLQKIVKNHDSVMHRVMGFLHQVDGERRSSIRGGPYANGNSGGMGISDLVAGAHQDHPASPLQQAQALLGEFSAENLINSKDLEARALDLQYTTNFATPPDHSSSAMGAPNSGGSSAHMGFATMNHHHADLENLVYPMGHSNGIDPVDSEHINNIPYGIPPNGILTSHHPNEMIVKTEGEKRKRPSVDPGWLRKPRILLVEDDNTCARIGLKFLTAFDCLTDIAHDGLEAVNKVNLNPNYDLILMDIIMPNLDGVSATACIRQENESPARSMPIIAMTSNIRSEDIEMYLRWGMNEVLPKPFTKEGMLRCLEKQLAHLKKPYTQTTLQVQPNMVFTTGSGVSAPLNLNMGYVPTSHKDDASPGKSPASSWNSPNQIGGSPQSQTQQQQFGQPMSAGGYQLTPTHAVPGIGIPGVGGAHFQTPNGRNGQQHRRALSGMSDMMNPVEEHPDIKRQRMYPPQQGSGFPQ